MREICTAGYKMLQAGEGFALATIIQQSGSTPRGVGAEMLIRADGSSIGTIGGGILEAEVKRCAQIVIAEKVPMLSYSNLDSQTAGQRGMICGGETEIYIDYVNPQVPDYVEIYRMMLQALENNGIARLGMYVERGKPPHQECRQCLLLPDGKAVGPLLIDTVIPESGLDRDEGFKVYTISDNRQLYMRYLGNEPKAIIFGAGHISEKLVPMLSMVGFDTIVLDDRSEFANTARFPTADRVIVLPDFSQGLFEIEPCDCNTFCVIVTRGHAFDSIVLEQCLGQPARYIGMIGSRTKRDAIYAKLKNRGINQEQIDRIHSPIGVDIGAQTPEEIAVSITAEMIRVRRRGQ